MQIFDACSYLLKMTLRVVVSWWSDVCVTEISCINAKYDDLEEKLTGQITRVQKLKRGGLCRFMITNEKQHH